MQHSRRTGARPSQRKTSGRRGAVGRPSTDLLVALGYLVLVSLFGGGLVEWSPSYILLMLATVGLAVFLAWRDGFTAFATAPPAGRIALSGIAALPLLQLVPLPPEIWQALPGQELRRATLGMMGIVDTWQPMTLEPVSTAMCAILAIGFVTFTGLLLRLGDAEFRKLLVATFALIVLGMGVGLLQVVSYGYPHFFPASEVSTLLGFFANKNHMALAIACAILLLGLIVRHDNMAPSRRRLAVGGFILFALVCIVTTNSRAGLGLGLLAAAIVLADLSRGIAMRWRLAALAGIALLAVAVATSSVFEVVSRRLDSTGDDPRWQFAAWSWPLAKHYAAFGSGFGSFKTVYQAQEPLAHLMFTYVNAVHDDYLQLAIEAGVPGLVVLLVLVLSLAGSIAAWRTLPRNGQHRREMGAGLAVIALFAVHSVLDYPLRRPAAWILFSIALASVYRAPRISMNRSKRLDE